MNDVSAPQVVDVEAPLIWYRVTVRKRHGRKLHAQSEDVLIQARNAAHLQEQLAAIKGRVEGWAAAHLHTCSTCGKTAPWDASWSWYGSYADEDNGKQPKKFCGVACGGCDADTDVAAPDEPYTQPAQLWPASWIVQCLACGGNSEVRDEEVEEDGPGGFSLAGMMGRNFQCEECGVLLTVNGVNVTAKDGGT